MGMTIAFILLAIAVALFLAVRQNWIHERTLQLWANIAGIVALIAAAAMFIVPAPAPPEPTPVPTTGPERTSTPQPTSTEMPTPTSGTLPSGVTGFTFESGVDGWTSSQWGKKSMTITTTAAKVYRGRQAMEVTTPLYGNASDKYDTVPEQDREVYRHTDVTAYFDKAIPEGMNGSGPYNLAGKRVTCAVYLPNDLATKQDPYANIHLFVKDIGYRNQQSKRIAIRNDNQGKTTEQWLLLSLTIGQHANGEHLDNGFRKDKIMALGVAVEAASGSTIEYEGPFYVDDCMITDA
jgi:hypothetical protein